MHINKHIIMCFIGLLKWFVWEALHIFKRMQLEVIETIWQKVNVNLYTHCYLHIETQ